jgi:hypothetical protein
MAVVRGPESQIVRASDSAFPVRAIRSMPASKRYPYPRSTKGCSVVFIQLVIRPFWADFVFSGRQPV